MVVALFINICREVFMGAIKCKMFVTLSRHVKSVKNFDSFLVGQF